MYKGYSRFLDFLEKIEKFILTATVLIMMFTMLYQIILRYCFSAGNAWSEELTRYLFIFNVMIACAMAVRHGSHLQIDVLVSGLKTKDKCILTLISTFLGICFMLFLLVYSVNLCVIASNNISPGLEIPMSIPYASMPIGTVLMILAALEVIFKQLEILRSKEADG